MAATAADRRLRSRTRRRSAGRSTPPTAVEVAVVTVIVFEEHPELGQKDIHPFIHRGPWLLLSKEEKQN